MYVYIIVKDISDFDAAEEVHREVSLTLIGAKRIAKRVHGVKIGRWVCGSMKSAAWWCHLDTPWTGPGRLDIERVKVVDY
jgi:hypothetical protein